jgi:L-threonate 2-dehydrogenase
MSGPSDTGQAHSKTVPVGFVGLGKIGLPAALNMISAGHVVHGYMRRPKQAFIEAHGIAATLDEVARCSIVMLCLPDSSSLEVTVDRLVLSAFPGQVIADLGSSPIAFKARQADKLARAGAIMLDCEVSGLPLQVADRSAAVFVGGDAAAAHRCTPLFACFSARQFYLGPFGMASTMKLVANFMVAAHNLVAAEALNLGRAAGLDMATMVDVLKSSAAHSATFANKAPLMVSRNFAGGRGPFSHMFGHLDRAAALATASGVAEATPVLSRTREIYALASAENRHDQDIAAIIEIVERMGGAAAPGGGDHPESKVT